MTISHGLQQLSARTTRRSFFGRAGRLALAAVGIGVIYERSARAYIEPAYAQSSCSDPTWCGLCGKPCDNCGGSVNTCPSGTSVGSGYWTGCCCFQDGTCHLLEYWDCCSSGSVCSTANCFNNCPQGTWCSGTYYCTVALFPGTAC